jgi:hypothetical protein
MKMQQIVMASTLTAFCLAGFTQADEGRYVVENGITYYDTYRVVQRPVMETACQQTTRTVYKEQFSTETKDVTRTSWTPVTVYRAETQMVGKWNFFIEPYYETHWVAETQWVPHNEVVKMPVTCRKLVPETQTVQVPVTTQKMVDQYIRTSRVAVNGISPTGASINGPVARPTPQNSPVSATELRYQPPQPGDQIGGVARLNQDPPRNSTSPGTAPPTR